MAKHESSAARSLPSPLPEKREPKFMKLEELSSRYGKSKKLARIYVRPVAPPSEYKAHIPLHEPIPKSAYQFHPEQELPSIVRQDERSMKAHEIKSTYERSRADHLIESLVSRLSGNHVSERDLDQFGEKLSEIKDEIEKLQAFFRHPPEGQSVGKEGNQAFNQNFQTIEKLENAIRASKMSAAEALSELKYGARVRGLEVSEEQQGENAKISAEELSQKIEKAYGAPPEDLINGYGPLGKRLKFTFKNWLARLSGTETDFDRWQEAERDKQSAELARMERLPQDRKRRLTAEERAAEETEVKEDAAGRVSAIERQKTSDKELAMRVLTPKRVEELTAEIAGQMDLMRKETPRFSFTPEEYVVTAAHYVDSLEHELKGGIKEYKNVLNEMNEELNFPKGYDPLVGAGRSRPVSRVAETPRKPEAKKEEPIELSPEDVELIEEEPVVFRKSRVNLKKRAEEARKQKEALETPDIEVHDPAEGEKERSREFRKMKKPEALPAESMTTSRALELVPDAKKLWDVINEAVLKSDPTIQNALKRESLVAKNEAATNLVFLIAAMREAAQKNDEDTEKKLRESVASYAAKLRLNLNSYFQDILNPKKYVFKDALKGTKQRQRTVTTRQSRWKTG